MMSQQRQSRRNRHETGQNSHRWVISYADFITLLFAFFVVMYSMSQVNVSKYRVLSDSLKETFSTDKHDKKGIGNTIENRQSVLTKPLPANSANLANNADVKMLSNTELVSQVNQIAEKLSLQNDMQVSGNEDRIEINLNANILFQSGSAEPSYAAEVIFEELASQFQLTRNTIDVEGYTDNKPINNWRYQSNWELSSARAVSVVQLLQHFGVEPNRLSAIGYGEFRPISANTTDEERSKNRRVVLVLHREADKRPVLTPDDLPVESSAVTTGSLSTGSVAAGSVP